MKRLVQGFPRSRAFIVNDVPPLVLSQLAWGGSNGQLTGDVGLNFRKANNCLAVNVAADNNFALIVVGSASYISYNTPIIEVRSSQRDTIGQIWFKIVQADPNGNIVVRDQYGANNPTVGGGRSGYRIMGVVRPNTFANQSWLFYKFDDYVSHAFGIITNNVDRYVHDINGTNKTHATVTLQSNGASGLDSGVTIAIDIDGVVTHRAIQQTGNAIQFGPGPIPNTAIRTDIQGALRIGGDMLVSTSTTQEPSAALQVDSTTKGFLLPRMTTAERDAIVSPAAGLMVYDTDTNKSYTWNGSTWNEHY